MKRKSRNHDLQASFFVDKSHLHPKTTRLSRSNQLKGPSPPLGHNLRSISKLRSVHFLKAAVVTITAGLSYAHGANVGDMRLHDAHD